MKRFYKYIFFLFIIFFNFDVFASNYDITSKIKATTSGSTGKYYGLEIYNTGTNTIYSTNTRYSGRLSKIEFFVNTDDFNWDYNKTYTITLNMATDDWRNNFMGPLVYRTNSDGSIPSTATNMYVNNSFQFISMKKIKFNFKIPSVMGPYIKFTIYSGNVNSTYITGVSNWNLSSIVISDITSSTPTPAPVTPTPSPTPQPNNQDIINNNNQNTQDIINNNNTNTQDIINSNNSNTSDIIENNNSNTQAIIDNNKETNYTCFKNIYSDSISDWHSVDFGGATRWGYKLILEDNQDYSIRSFNNTLSVITACVNYVCSEQIGYTNNTLHFHTRFNVDYYLIYRGSSNQSTAQDAINNAQTFLQKGNVELSNYIEPGEEYCTNKQDELNNSINEVNNSINNDNIDDKTSFFTDFDNDDHNLTRIITAPLSTIQQLTETSCIELTIPIPFTNSTINLPCMETVYRTYIANVYYIWRIVSYGIVSYFICIDIFKMVKGFKDPNEDKIEVVDL